MKKILFLLLVFIPFSSFADCAISTNAPKITQNKENIEIKWLVKGACSDSINEFKAYYLDGENWTPITTILAGKNKAKYSINWDISSINSGLYKVRILQDGDTKAYSTSEEFLIDKNAPTIRDDVWILPSGGEVVKGDIIIKWNKESIFDDHKLAEKPVSFYYSFDNEEYISLIEGFENSGIFVAKTSEISAEKIYLKIVATDSSGNKSLKILQKTFSIDNTAPKPANILKINGLKIKETSFSTRFSPFLDIENIDIEDRGLRIVIFDKKTDKVYGSLIPTKKEENIQLSPMKDGKYNLKVGTIDLAGNFTESTGISLLKDSISPIAPKITYGAIVNNNLRVVVGELKETGGELILMNGKKELFRQSDSNLTFELSQVPQGIYDLYVLHTDKTGNISDKSNEKKVIFDTASPKNIKTSFPKISLYGDIDIKISYIDNIGAEKSFVYLDGKKIGEAENFIFNLKTNMFKNGEHKIKLEVVDFAGNSSFSEEFDLKIFNSSIKGHWANSYIRDLYDKQILSGEGNSGKINPEGDLNRASSLKIITSFFDIKTDLNSIKKSTFADIPDGIWYKEIINSAYKKGIVKGFQEKYQIKKVLKSFKDEDVKNLQYVLKGLGYNLQITSIYDKATIRAIANYQKSKGLKGTASIGPNTLYFLNEEEIVKNEKIFIDDLIYFKPGEKVNRVQVLKMILKASGLEVPNKSGAWYKKYTDFAQENGIMTGNKKGDLMLEKGVTIGEISKMLLKTKDLINKK